MVAVGVHVGNGAQRDTGVKGGLRHGRRDLHHQPWVKRLGNQVLRPKSEWLTDVGCGHHFALLGLRQLDDGVHGGDFHLHRDGGSTRIKRATKDVGEAQDVVDLVRVVRAAGGDDGVVAHGFDVLG